MKNIEGIYEKSKHDIIRYNSMAQNDQNKCGKITTFMIVVGSPEWNHSRLFFIVTLVKISVSEM